MGTSRPKTQLTARLRLVERRPKFRGLPHAIDVEADDFDVAHESDGDDVDTIALAELTPQIEIAWVDGRVSSREREAILDAATYRGVRPYSRAHDRLDRWLERRPPDRVFRSSRDAIQRMFRRLPWPFKVNVRRSLLEECRAVARASGGVLGWGSVSTDEQQVIDSFAAELDLGDPAGRSSENGRRSTRAGPADDGIPGGCDSVPPPPPGR